MTETAYFPGGRSVTLICPDLFLGEMERLFIAFVGWSGKPVSFEKIKTRIIPLSDWLG